MPFLTEDTLMPAVAQGRTLVLCRATWCPFCRAFEPVFRRRTGSLADLAVAELVLDDEHSPLWSALNLAVVPSVLLFENGKITRRLDGRLGVGLADGPLDTFLDRLPH